jgi:hypothetical protein
LNGQQVLELQNRMIRSEDRVLVSVGMETPDEALASEYAEVASNAGHFNEVSDPAGCAGAMREVSLGERLRNAFWGP